MTIECWLDSETPPTAAQVAQAKAAGYSGWAGYLATKSGVGLARPWTQAEFQVVRDGGLKTLGYCSGWDDAAACKAKAAQFGIPIALDCEPGIRGDGAWVQPWLDASGAGFYGNYWTHAGKTAPFHILTGGNYWTGGTAPVETWDTALCPRPSGPCGWQWCGTHTEFGDGVDDSYFDAEITQENEMTPEQVQQAIAAAVAQVERDSANRLTVALYGLVLGRTPDFGVSGGADWCTDAIVSGKPITDIVSELVNSPEAQQYRATGKPASVPGTVAVPTFTGSGVTAAEVEGDIAKKLGG